MNSEEEYVVGPGKPPRGTRFKKGQIANPNGRRGKKAEREFDPAKTLQLVDNEKILVTIDGKRKRITKAEINYIQLFTQSFRGILSAARTIADIAATCFGPQAESDRVTIFEVMPEGYFDQWSAKDDPDGKIREESFTPIQRIYPPTLSTLQIQGVSAAALFRKVASEKIAIEVNGRTEKLTRWDAYIRQIYTMALNKNNGAARLIAKLRKQFPGEPLPGEPYILRITESDTRL
jgi:hypothetical protein